MGMRDRIAKAILGGKVGGPTPTGIHVYHSSPHDFDRFDLSKIGTGEGAQVYGHGIYFAENPKVSGQGGQYWQQFLNRFPESERNLAEQLKYNQFNREAVADQLDRYVRDYQNRADTVYSKPHMAQARERILKEMETFKADRDLVTSGASVGPRTYEVNIRAQPEQLLNLDNPVGGQSPYVKERLKSLGIVPQDASLTGAQAEAARVLDRVHGVFKTQPTTADWVYRDIGEMHDAVKRAQDPYAVYRVLKDIPMAFDIPHGNWRGSKPGLWDQEGSQVLQGIANVKRASMPEPTQMHIESALGSPERAADALRSVEIPGSRYLDQGSRGNFATGTKDLTRNYVVNDPSKLDIMAKYGVVGGVPVGMGALAAQDSYGAQQ